MTAMPGGARRADAARNARLLLAAARTLFDEHGPDVPLDEVARRAGVANATLYRHYPSRGDLLVAVYADEVAALCDRGDDLLRSPAPGEAFFTWLEAFIVHVATRRTLAFAGTAGGGERRTALFDHWHRSMTSTARKLLSRAQDCGTVRTDLNVTEVLALSTAIATSATDAEGARRLISILHHGLSGPAPRS